MVRKTKEELDTTKLVFKELNKPIKYLNIVRINFYIDKGVDLESKDENGKTILHLAVAVGDIDTVMKIIRMGADVNERDNEGKTPLHYAHIYGLPEIKTFLEENGAKDIPDNSGVKPSDIVMPTHLDLDENNQIPVPDGGKRSRRRRRRTQRKSKRKKQTRRRK